MLKPIRASKHHIMVIVNGDRKEAIRLTYESTKHIFDLDLVNDDKYYYVDMFMQSINSVPEQYKKYFDFLEKFASLDRKGE